MSNNKSELEKEMMELFDDFGYKAPGSSGLGDFDDSSDTENTKDKDEINTDDLISEILDGNDKFTLSSYDTKVSAGGDKDMLFEDMESNLQKEIVAKLRMDEDANKAIMEEDSDVYHLNKILFIKNDTYKTFFKNKRKKSENGDEEVELGREEIDYAINMEKNLINMLIENIKIYFDQNDIRYSNQWLHPDTFEGYRLVDNAIEDVTSVCGIKVISVVKDVGVVSKYIYMSTKFDKIIVSKNFKSYKSLNLNKIIFKKIKLDDIIYLVEKHY